MAIAESRDTAPGAGVDQPKPPAAARGTRGGIAGALWALAGRPDSVALQAWDGSAAGVDGAPLLLRLRSIRALRHAVSAPGQLGLSRAYVDGDIDLDGDPYEALKVDGAVPCAAGGWAERAAALRDLLAAAGPGMLRPLPPPPQEVQRQVAPGHPALQGPRRRRHRPPLRRGQPLLRTRPRPDDGLHLRGLPPPGRHAGGGADREGRPRVPQARPASRDAPARRRLRLGRSRHARRPRVRRPRAGRDPVQVAGGLGGAAHRGARLGRARRGAPRRLPGRDRDRIRRDRQHRLDRAHRRAPARRLRRPAARSAAAGGPAAQPLHHPAARRAAPFRPAGVHRPLRLPRRRAARPGAHRRCLARRRARSAPRGEPA